MKTSISFLLAAGFSAPMGYPIGNDLNNKLKNFDRNSVGFYTDGKLVVDQKTGRPDLGFKTRYDNQYDFCIDLINYYCTKHDFDYEKFYDYMQLEAFNDTEAKSISEKYWTNGLDYHNLLTGSCKIYNQLIAWLLKDENNTNRYDDDERIDFDSSITPKYEGFLKYITSFNSNTSVHIHTLNHDLLFEYFNRTDFFNKEKISDGFSDIGSKFYSKLSVEEINGGIKKQRSYWCRLERYTGRYKTRYRLYKLHGSLNYYRYYRRCRKKKIKLISVPDVYVKHLYGTQPIFYKECRGINNRIDYIPSFVDYYADFLTGTTTKIMRYKETWLYGKLFKLFCNNLRKSEKLIIVGYGCKDEEINNLIINNFDYQNKSAYIIDPFAGNTVVDFSKKINAKIIKKQLCNISENDFD